MTKPFAIPASILKPLSAALAIAAVASSTVAQARDDGGMLSFLQQEFGGNGGEASQPVYAQPDYAQPRDSGASYGEQPSRPLTVRMHRPRHPAVARASISPKDTLAAIKGVTIYTDKTLARGDAVMTVNGMRVFNGSTSWPYKDADFVAVSSMPKMRPEISRELHSMDIASRTDARN